MRRGYTTSGKVQDHRGIPPEKGRNPQGDASREQKADKYAERIRRMAESPEKKTFPPATGEKKKGAARKQKVRPPKK